MDDREYESLTNSLFAEIEDLLDELELDIDVDSSGGLINVEFANGTAVILSRQVANHEVWVAARSGGFHLAYANDDWFCNTTSETLSQLLNRVFTEQAGESVDVFS